MKSKPTLKIVLDKRWMRSNGMYAVKLRVTWQRKQKYYLTDVDLTPGDFERVFGDRPRDRYKAIRATLDAIEEKARQTIKGLPVFTFDRFERGFFNETDVAVSRQPTAKPSLLIREAFDEKVRILTAEDRLSTAEGYKFAANSILAGRPDLSFFDITPDFLHTYEKRMTDAGASLATVGIYLRYLRSLINEAIETELIPQSLYPFGKRKPKYQIPSKRNAPAPLAQNDVARITRHKPLNEAEARARDLWLFSLMMNGANMKDVLNLKWVNVDAARQRITFYRAKTRRTARHQKPIQVAITPPMAAIMEKWGNPPGKPSDYVFPIFSAEMSAAELKKANENFRQIVRKNMERIAAALGIEGKIHNYTARDTFAKAQRLAGESGDAIGEALGHENRSTTDTYLDAFEDDVKARIAKNTLRYLDADTGTE